ncbi:MAG: hypothetical protein WC848_00040 [Parcubacteria group bacterium]|jgi:hypothetical protein
MIELKINTFKVPISIDPIIRESFKDPLIFYLAHKEDWRPFFFTYVILDFLRQEFVYIVSYYPENISLINNLKDDYIFGLQSSAQNPHCSIRVGTRNAFLTFYEKTRYFTQVDFENNTMNVYTGEDIGLDHDEQVVDFGATFCRDEDVPDQFYFSVITQSGLNFRRKLRFYRAKLDFSEVEEIYAMPTLLGSSPHVTRKVGQYLLNSDFLTYQIKSNKSGKMWDDAKKYALHVYEDIYREYCLKKERVFLPDLFNDLESAKKIILKPGFNFFCQTKGKNILDICQDEKYAFTIGTGTIMLVRLNDKKVKYYETTYCCPAHFEVDRISGDVFVSSHNFIEFLDRVYYLGPAAIDRFSLSEDGIMEKKATFTHPLIYRMTSHKVFSYDGKTYVCSFGQPNRLVFIDAQTMEMMYYQDIEEDSSVDPAELIEIINNTNLEPITIKTIEASHDGKFIFFLSCKFIYIYNFPERRIVQKIEYLSDNSFGENLDLSRFYKRTTHVDYFV